MRQKQNPQMRKEVFLEAAQKLFFANGFGKTSIKDILDAVGVDASSPSVFYYYFHSKEEIYHEVLERYADAYVRDMEHIFSPSKPPLAAAKEMTGVFIRYFSGPRQLGAAGDSLAIRFLYLDLRDRVTKRFIPVWQNAFCAMAGTEDKSPLSAPGAQSCFLCGGISELISQYQQAGKTSRSDTVALAQQLIVFTCRILQIPKDTREKLLNGITDNE